MLPPLPLRELDLSDMGPGLRTVVLISLPGGHLRDAWVAAVPMNEWLDTHVGPSTLPPDEGPGWRR